MPDTPATPATMQDGTYPRPQLVRPLWYDLSGSWDFGYDDDDLGLGDAWTLTGPPAPRPIEVPYPPESPASGVGDTNYHRVLWYHRAVDRDEVRAAGHASGRRLLLHFGAVDYHADVWIDGHHVAGHDGGHTPFTAEVPDAIDGFDLVVRVEDDPEDLAQPRGKQDWEPRPHAVWYHRTSGIWQPVWIESVPPRHLRRITWRPDVAAGEVRVEVELDAVPAAGTRVHIALQTDSATLADTSADVRTRESGLVLPIPSLRNGQGLDHLLWSPENPALIDAVVRLEAPAQDADTVASYLGLRTVGTDSGVFLLNDRPHPVRGVLSQGYWPQSHLAAPGADALRREVELIKELGFTTVRMHQKIEDPRFLYWTDRLGLLVWEEMPSVYEFSGTASTRLIAEWTDAVRRDLGHPSVVVWVPFNESWGVQHLATRPGQRDLVRAMYHLTKSLDDSRPVISNDGWEHTRSDLLTVHDYENDAAVLLESYGDAACLGRSLDGIAPSGRRTFVGTPEERAATAAAPVLLSEFGGVSLDPVGNGTWGYRHVGSRAALEEHLIRIFAAVQGSGTLAGWCYTQLADTGQETNGLVDDNRMPKLPVELIRALVEGTQRPARATGMACQALDTRESSSELPPIALEPESRLGST
ncbi:MAG: glycoside hydrolase family 2 TIM barrel-domain containing protein [Protaetiibacter sp.]